MKKEFNNLIEAVEAQGNKNFIIFDMDGLIFDTERTFMEQLAIAMMEKGYTLTREKYAETLGLGGEKLKRVMYETYGDDYPFEETSRIAMDRIRKILESVGLTIKPGIAELLEYLRQKGRKCAVASSTHSDMVEEYLEKSNLRKYFEVIIGGEKVRMSKPEPDIFLLACEKLGCSPSEAVVLEDSENGVRAAAAAGIKVVCVPDLKEPCKEVYKMASAVVRI